MIKIIQIVFLLSCLLIQSVSQILAIDFGTQFIKAALVHSGAGKSFSIVENHKSERKFINAIGFYNDQRFYQEQALSKRNKLPTNCFIYSRLLIDFMNNSTILSTIKKDLILSYLNQNQQDQLVTKFILKHFSQDTDQITFLDIIAMIIKNVKLQAQKSSKTKIKDAVFTIPTHWNLKMRSFILSAAQIADLYVVGLIAENTAASINYALNQRHTNQTQKILFYNLGSNSLQLTLTQYKQINYQKSPKPIQSIFILDDYGKSFVGGLKFDILLAKHFYKQFENKYKKQLTQRAKIKIFSQINRVKQTLSSNKQATLIVQGLMDGIDFVQKITRVQFQEMAQPLFQQLTAPIRRFLLDNNLKTSDIKIVEMIGGGVRIPKLQNAIKNIIGQQAQVGTHINGDQAMALGSAFFAANSSKKFKVKGAQLYDGFNFQIRLVIRNYQQVPQQSQHFYLKNITLFKKKTRFGHTKQVNFKCKQNIIIQLYKQDQYGLELIRKTQLRTIQLINQTDYKISFTIGLDPINVVTIKDIKYTYKRQQNTTYLQKIKKSVTNKSQEQQDSNQQNKQQKQSDPQEQGQQQTPGDTGDQQQKINQKQQKQQQKQKKNKTKKIQRQQYQTVERTKIVTKKYERQLPRQDTFNMHQIDDNLINLSKKLLKKYQQNQQNWRKLAQSKNILQTIIYQSRDKLQNHQFLQFCQQQQKKLLQKQIKQQSQWLDQTVSNNIQDYNNHYQNIHKILGKIKKRIFEYHQRDQVKKRALQIISQYQNLTLKIKKQKQWITDQQIQQLKAFITVQKVQIDFIYQEMNNKPKFEDLMFKNKDLIKTAQKAKQKYFIVKATPKPKKQKQQDKQKKQQTNDQQEQQKQKEETKQDQL